MVFFFFLNENLVKQKLDFFLCGSSQIFLLNGFKSSHKDVLRVDVVASELMLLPSFVFFFLPPGFAQFDDACGGATGLSDCVCVCSPTHERLSVIYFSCFFVLFFYGNLAHS